MNTRVQKMFSKTKLEVKYIANELDYNLYHIDYCKISDDLGKMTFGLARVNRLLGTANILLNSSYIDKLDDVELQEVIAHEIIHCIAGCSDHGPRWKEVSKIYSERHGVNIQVYANDLIDQSDQVQKELFLTSNYVAECDTCNKCIYYSKDTSTIKYIRAGKTTCVCGGKYIMKKDMKYPDLNYDQLSYEDEFKYVAKCMCDNGNKRYYKNRNTKVIKAIRNKTATCKICGSVVELIKDGAKD